DPAPAAVAAAWTAGELRGRGGRPRRLSGGAVDPTRRLARGRPRVLVPCRGGGVVKVLVVDDEAPARRRLVRMLERLGGVEVVGEAADGEQALALVRQRAPELLLLDIDMPEMDGLELAEVPGLPPVVFTTAHAEHALWAFEVAAVDYLLKPISRERLAEAIERARARGWGAAGARGCGEPPREAPAAESSPRIIARSGGTQHVIEAGEITRFHATDKVTVFVHEGRELVLD